MGFDSHYKFYSSEKHSVSEKSTFLGFWGFHASKRSQTVHSKRPDKYIVESSGNDIYTLRKQSGGTTSSTLEWVEFTRYSLPTSKAQELENKFFNLVKDKYSESSIYGGKVFSPERTPYFCTSVEEYYNESNSIFTGLLGGVGIISAVAYGIYTIIQSGLITGLLEGFLACILIAGPATLIGMLVDFIILKSRPYRKLSQTKKEKLRKKYLKSLSVGIEEANEILREYAKLKGYDRI